MRPKNMHTEGKGHTGVYSSGARARNHTQPYAHKSNGHQSNMCTPITKIEVNSKDEELSICYQCINSIQIKRKLSTIHKASGWKSEFIACLLYKRIDIQFISECSHFISKEAK